MKLKKRMIGLSTILCMVLVFVFNVNIVYAAGSFSVSGGGTVSAGASKTITVTTSNCAGQFSVSISGGGSVSTTSLWVDGSSTFTATAPSSGSATITVKATDVTDTDFNAVTGSKTTTLTVQTTSSNDSSSGSSSGGSSSSGSSSSGSSSTTTTVTKSSDNKLSALTVSEGTLSPEFSASTTEYSVNVTDVETITINATKSDSAASISGTGEKTLESGENEFSIVVTAENGSTKTYTVLVNLTESPTAYLTYNEVELGVVKNVTEVVAPDGFEETTAIVAGEEVTAWTSNLLGMTILYMTNEAGVEDFYLYDETTGTLADFSPLGLLGRNVYIVEIPEADQSREGMVYQAVSIDGNPIMGWTYESDSLADYCLIYVMGDTGQMVEYLYCISDNSMIIAPQMAPVSNDEYAETVASLAASTEGFNTLNSDYTEQSQLLQYMKYAILAAIVLVILLLIVMIILIVKLKKRRHNSKVMYEGYVDADEFADESFQIDDGAYDDQLDAF